MNELTKQRIQDRLAGVRFTVEENLQLTDAGVAFAHLKGQLDMLDIVEHVLQDFFDEDAENDG